MALLLIPFKSVYAQTIYLNNLVNDINKELESDDEDKTFLELNEENEIELQPSYKVIDESKIDYESITVYCYIYRAENIDGPYEKINDMFFNCNQEDIYYIDQTAKPNKTYYYKAVIDENINNSKITEITLPLIGEKEEEAQTTKTTEEKMKQQRKKKKILKPE